jgi:AraC-like DNA-binding protein
MKKQPALEKISPDFGSSIFVKQHTKNRKMSQALWHFHPEIELVYVNEGRGKRHIGNHLSYFNKSQLILIGANLPHRGFTDRLTSKGRETVVQFKPDFLGDSSLLIPEMTAIAALLNQAKKGILFGKETKDVIGSKIENLVNLKGFVRTLSFLELLNSLANTSDYTLLNVDGFAFEITYKDSVKIDIIYTYINKNFYQPITLEEIANESSMTVTSFCRFFKKATAKTFIQVVNEYRIVHATKLLTESQLSIADICYASGFNNFSHFNKHFKMITGKTALNYRKEIKRIVEF